MNAIKLCNLDKNIIDVPIAVSTWRADLKNGAAREELIMLQRNGMYWLVPIEIIKESVMVLEHRDKSEKDYNVLPPVTITVEQCIPIPSETAKILMEL